MTTDPGHARVKSSSPELPNDYLDADKLCQTIDRLCQRIADRFPGSGLLQVGRDLHTVCMSAEKDIDEIGRPDWALRLVVLLFVVATVAVFVAGLSTMQVDTGAVNYADLIQAAEAALSSTFLVGAALLFLISIETRVKRRRVIEAINRLRSIAHVIDMHQLTKDPATSLAGGPSTPASPHRSLSDFEMNRYLDYCTEMLSLVGKVGFLYVQDFSDPEATKAMNDLEDLATGLTNGIWQKIILIGETASPARALTGNPLPPPGTRHRGSRL
jgi:hypothetical protein